MFYVGQLVLCVDDRETRQLGITPVPGTVFVGGLGGLRRGAVYTIRRVGVHWYWGNDNVWLEEIVRQRLGKEPEEVGFASSRFRPLKDSALDVFTALLEPAPKETQPA